MENFAFNPPNGFKDASAFSDPANETETRSQLFTPHEQTRDFMNGNMIPQLNANTSDITDLKSAVLALQGTIGDPDAIAAIVAAVQQIQDFLAITDDIVYVG